MTHSIGITFGALDGHPKAVKCIREISDFDGLISSDRE